MGKKCFISNLLIKNAERRENGVKARVKKTDAARISFLACLEVRLVRSAKLVTLVRLVRLD